MFVPELRERIVFYSSKMITEQINKGESYSQIKKVISINILDFELINDNTEYHNIFHLYDERTKTTFTDILEIHTLELSKLPTMDDNTELFDWLKFFKAKGKGEFMMLAEKSPVLQRAYDELEHLSQDKMTRELYESRLKAQRDEISRLEGAEKKGIEKRNAEIAKTLFADGIDISYIAKITGLTEDEIKKL